MKLVNDIINHTCPTWVKIAWDCLAVFLCFFYFR